MVIKKLTFLPYFVIFIFMISLVDIAEYLKEIQFKNIIPKKNKEKGK